MKVPLPLLLLSCLLPISCGRPNDEASKPADSVKVSPPPAQQEKPKPTSVMRPEVAEKVDPPAPPPPTEPLRLVVGFVEPGARLDDKATEAIDRLLFDPRFTDDKQIRLAGHTDSIGSDSDNLRVSRLRAEAVRDYLVAKGIAADRISVIALGERRPLEPNAHADGSDFPEGRQRNRRVEIMVSPPQPEAPEAEPGGQESPSSRSGHGLSAGGGAEAPESRISTMSGAN
ncbi:OmpA family protein [Sphingosinicella rhizophila]|uniref:OmpA family protein n=1 Tax=Sphingosinicella rhizophila TaxID=3050082 RepID=A0ABU3QB19_9SPHN|nr:OmpA family protein [Sphingosinicella sp. GR2756]MDT9600522.1 OmpA family protein [Sphingosinicella sp. GR2756]